ncbi:hypothetical protein D3C78_816340 [compost metagenome]
MVLVDVWPVEGQPGQSLADDLGAGILEFPVLQIEHAGKHGQHQRQVERIEAKQPRYRKCQPVVLPPVGEQAVPEQKAGDHEKEGDAALAELRVEVARRKIDHAGLQKDPGNDRVVHEHAEGQVPAQAVDTGKTAFAGMLQLSGKSRHAAQQ